MGVREGGWEGEWEGASGKGERVGEWEGGRVEGEREGGREGGEGEGGDIHSMLSAVCSWLLTPEQSST